MKNKKLSTKILSFIMTFLVLAISLPIYAFASAIDTKAENKETIEETINSAQAISDELYVLEEDVTLREENAKHFKLSDGTMKAVSYAQAVHYKDENGNWIDIDNSLTLSGSEYATSNKQEIKFANKSGSNGLISIKDGEYKIDFTPLNTNKVSVEIENPEGNNSRKFDDVKKLNKLVSKATYKDIYSGIDLEYILVGNNIKENIIVKEKQSEYSFSFEIKLSKLNAELENNAIVLTDSETGEKVYEIPAPYMLDANGEYSDSVEYTLTKDSKWKYTLTVVADPSWINAEEREFPVKIDPTVTTGSITKELFVMEDGVYDNLPSLIIGNFMGFYYDATGFIKFDALTGIEEDTILLDAKLLLHVPYIENQTGRDFNVGVYKAKSDWYTGTYNINHSNKSEYFYPTLVDEKTMTETGVYSWDITGMYKEWLANSGSNHGVCIKGIDLPTENDTTVSSEIANIRVTTTLNTDGYMVPTIELSYRYLVGVEDYYAYAENTLGDVGKSYVNLYNGSLTYINKLTSIEVGENLTYDINMVYNSIDKAWTPSFYENVEPYTALGVEQYIWTDEDGTKHLFTPHLEKNFFGAYATYELSPTEKWPINDPTIFYPEDDIDYVLVQTTNNELILRDYQGNQKMFDANGRLSRICDAQGNVIYINNHLGENNIATIHVESSTQDIIFLAEMRYNSNGKLCYIYDVQNEKELDIFWNGNYINYISYHNYGETTSYKKIVFEYDENNTNLEYVFDNSINQKMHYYIDEKEDEDAPNDETIIESININGTEEEITKKYIVGKGFYKDLGQDLTENTNDDFSEYVTFDEKGREIIKGHTYNDELRPDTIYFSILYNPKIYIESFNAFRYNIETGFREYITVNRQGEALDISNVTTTNTGRTYKLIENTQNAPYNMVCKVKVYYDGSSTPKESTAFLTGSNTLIMSAHGLLKPNGVAGIYGWEFPTKAEIIPGCYIKNGEEQTPFGTYDITEFYIQKEYYYLRDTTLTEKYQYDWAVCVLDENVDERLGYFTLTIPDDNLNDKPVQVIGYREKVSNSDMKIHMYYSRGKIQAYQKTIDYNALTAQGMSGGPLLLYNTNCVIGIHVYGGENVIIAGAKKIDSLIYSLVDNLNST